MPAEDAAPAGSELSDLLTTEVDLTEAAVSSDRTNLPPSADTPVEEMKFDTETTAWLPATANRVESTAQTGEGSEPEQPAPNGSRGMNETSGTTRGSVRIPSRSGARDGRYRSLRSALAYSFAREASPSTDGSQKLPQLSQSG